MLTIITERNVRFRRLIDRLLRRNGLIINRQLRENRYTRVVRRVLRTIRTTRRDGRTEVATARARYPQHRTALQLALFRTHRSVIQGFQRTTARRQLRVRYQGTAFQRLTVGVFNINVAQVCLFHVLPIRVVRLSRRGVPFVFVIVLRRVVGRACVTVMQRAGVTCATYLTLLRRGVRRAVVSVTLTRLLRTIITRARAVRRRVIGVVRLRLLRQIVMRFRQYLTTPLQEQRVQRFNQCRVFVP